MAGSDSAKPVESLVQTRVSELFSGRITDRKLDGNNYLQWKRVVEIYVASRGKTSHLTTDPPTPTLDSWTLDDNILLHQILTSMEFKIQDLVLHCLIVKELWAFLTDLYGGRSDVNRAYDVIQELFRKKQDDKNMDDHYGEFNRLAEELCQIFPITEDIKQMQSQWNQLMVLTYLGTLDPAYSSARSQIMESFAVSSFAEMYHFLKNAISAPPSTPATDSQDHFALATQNWQSTSRSGYSGGRGRGRGGSDGRGGYNGGRSTGRGGQRGDRGGPSRGNPSDDSVIYCHYCHEPGHMKFNCPKKKGKETYLTSQDFPQDSPSQQPSPFPYEQLCRQFEQFQFFQQYQHTQAGPSSSSATLAQAAILAYKTIGGTKNFKKLVHLSIQFLALGLGLIGVWAALKFHNDKGIDNFYSLHSWLGLACLFLFGIQWGTGFVTFWYPGGSRNSRASLLPWHVFFGTYIYVLAIVTAATGILEKATFLQTNNVITRYSSESLLVNVLGILIVILGGFVVLAVVTPGSVNVNAHRGVSE